mmetsp:Transcript_54969/g.116828  ORF Transcript_54969/g.116828 Transcript_54969/m.116828 type:complete len:89 (+) Transcript_54969:66-332(+)
MPLMMRLDLKEAVDESKGSSSVAVTDSDGDVGLVLFPSPRRRLLRPLKKFDGEGSPISRSFIYGNATRRDIGRAMEPANRGDDGAIER